MNVRRENVGRFECQTIAQQFNNYKNADQQLSSALQEQV